MAEQRMYKPEEVMAISMKMIDRTTYGVTQMVKAMIEKGYSVKEIDDAMTTISDMVKERAINSPEDEADLQNGLRVALEDDKAESKTATWKGLFG